MMKYSFKLSLLVVVLILGIVGSSLAQDANPVVLGPITQRIIERGELICGVNAALPGFSAPNDAGQFVGFDVDFCRAVAAAILGSADAVSFRPLTAAERQAALQAEEIDMLSRNTTFTLSRDTSWGATFAPTTFYDGQGVMTTTESGITTLEGLEGLVICTNQGTTTEGNITDAMRERGLAFELQTFAEFPQAFEAFLAGGCDAVTTDISGLVSYQATAPDPGALYILRTEDGSDYLRTSKEPLGPVTPQSDAQFADIVRWTIYGMFAAEEFGISSETIDAVLAANQPGVEGARPVIQRLLGIGENPSGSYLGIANNFVEVVVRQVGNYGEVFARNLSVAPFNIPRGLNELYTNGGLIYAPPFR
ncbi:MAG: amino acid ABC transporter substrate-binding protein [Chloroflexi bacterium]|nr:amino acid ABC transporter substrate-binding protein [Chloroflexota bacterium]